MIELRLQKPVRFGHRPDLPFDPVFQRELARGKEDPDYKPIGLDEEARLHYRFKLLEHRKVAPKRDLFIAEYIQTRQQLLAPRLTDPIADRCAGWSQPEAQAFWETWALPEDARPRDVPSYEAAKGMLLATALGGTHLKAGRSTLSNTPLMLETVTRLAKGTTRGATITDELLPINDYSAMTRLAPVVAEGAPALLQQLCVNVAQTLAEMFPTLPIGHYVSIDAQKVAAWAAQKSGKRNGVEDPELEAFRRRRCPHAGFRSYGYDRDGGGDPNERKTITNYNNWRGYLQLPVCDLTTGLPLVGVIADASKLREPHALNALLTRLHAMWPAVPLEAVVGDKLYDDAAANLTCELDFGVASAFIRRPSNAGQEPRLFTPEVHPTIAYIDGWGVAVCREHGLKMRMETLERPSRTGLGPGQPAPANKLRYRFACRADDPCRASLGLVDPRVGALASALTRLPHHPDSGREREYARRLALYAARNSASESTHGSLQCGYRLATEGPDRPRVYDLATLETLFWLAYATRALLLLLAHRTYYDEVCAHVEKLKRPERTSSYYIGPRRGRAA
jgi:hypothetical protein